MDSLRVCAGVALSLAVLCSSERPNVIAREAATGSLTGRVHVVAHPARRLATAGAYPGRIVGIQGEPGGLTLLSIEPLMMPGSDGTTGSRSTFST